MKKLILISLVALGAMYNAAAFGPYSTTVVVQPNTVTNLLFNKVPTNGQFIVNQVIMTAGSTNASVVFVDSPNGTLTNVVPAYISSFSYATNLISSWTNQYGTFSWTNLTLVDYTNTVAAVTNFWPTPIAASALAGTTTVINNGNYPFNNGLFVTNNSTGQGVATVTINYNIAPFPSH